MTIDWSKAPEGHDVHIEWSHSDNFYRVDGGRYVRDGGYYAVIEEAHQVAVEVTFRPGAVGCSGDGITIRTPEQIAADEREGAINGMLCYDALGNSRRGLAEALYDAGYRKQEAP